MKRVSSRRLLHWVFLIMLIVGLAVASSPTRSFNLRPLPDDYWQKRNDEHPSPNGRWKAIIKYTEPVRVTDSLGRQSFEIQDPISIGPINLFVAWFPDSTGFITFNADQCYVHCSYDRLIIYRLEGKDRLPTPYVFEPIAERNRAFYSDRITWSPNGERFAVIVGQTIIYILNRQAEVMGIVRSDLEGYSAIGDIAWAKSGLIYTIPFSEMRMADPDRQEKPHVLLRKYYIGWQWIVSVDPYSPRVLIYSQPASWSDPHEAVIFNLESKQVEQALFTREPPEELCDEIEPADDRHLIAIRTCMDGENFYIYDWSIHS